MDRPRLNAEAGRAASVGQLRRHLASAPPPFLEGAVQNSALDRPGLMLLLRNRRATSAVLKCVAANPEWVSVYEIKKLLVLHPRTPLQITTRLIPHLYWNDLAEASDSPRLHPASRRRAEEVLQARLQELALGEQISLARRATRGVISQLLENQEPRVMRSLLANERLLEAEATSIAESGRAPGPLLAFLSTHPRWGVSHAVRMALLHNPRTPVPAALGLLRRLHRDDLVALGSSEGVPAIVRIGADRELGRDAGNEGLDRKASDGRG